MKITDLHFYCKMMILWFISKDQRIFYVCITNHARKLVCRNDPEIKWPPQSMYMYYAYTSAIDYGGLVLA